MSFGAHRVRSCRTGTRRLPRGSLHEVAASVPDAGVWFSNRAKGVSATIDGSRQGVDVSMATTALHSTRIAESTRARRAKSLASAWDRPSYDGYDDGRCVVIRIKNYRTGRREERRMTGEEFVQRFALHILPERMMRVRYAGLFFARRRAERLALCRRLLGVREADNTDDAPCASPSSASSAGDARQRGGQDVSAPRYSPECERCGLPTTWAGANRTAAAALALVAYVRYQLSALGTRVTVVRDVPQLPLLEPLSITCLPAPASNCDAVLAHCVTVLPGLPPPET